MKINDIMPLIDNLLPKLQEIVPAEQHDKLGALVEDHRCELEDCALSEKTKWLGWGWIPVLIGLLLLIITVNYLLLPVISLFTPVKHTQLPTEFWTLTIMSVSAHLTVKTIDKHVPQIIEKIGNTKKPE